MRFFIDAHPGPEMEGDEVRFRATHCYLEMECRLDEGFLVLYFIPRTATSLFVAACWDRTFDPILENAHDEDYLAAVERTWPTLAELLANGLADRYSTGALIRLEDADTGEPKWFLATVAGNLDLANVADWVGPRTQPAQNLIVQRSLALAAELQNNRSGSGSFWDLAKAIGKQLVLPALLAAISGAADLGDS
jgi:hypothetical protein